MATRRARIVSRSLSGSQDLFFSLTVRRGRTPSAPASWILAFDREQVRSRQLPHLD